MIPSISYWSIQNGDKHERPIDEALEEAALAGFSGLELAIAEQGVLSFDSKSKRCAKVRRMIEQSGLLVETLASGMSWGCNPISDDPKTRNRAIMLHKEALRVASEIGLKALLFVPGNLVENGSSIRYDIAYDRAKNAIESLLPAAELYGVDLLIENVWNGLFYSPMEMCQFIDSFRHPRLGVYFDAGNLLGIHQHPADWIPILGERIRRVHIKDFDCKAHEFCELGHGDLPWEACKKALTEISYNETIVAEMFPWSPGLVERTANTMHDWLKE